MYKLDGFINTFSKQNDVFLSPLFLKNGKNYFQDVEGNYTQVNLLELIVDKHYMYLPATKAQESYANTHEKIYAFQHNRDVVVYDKNNMQTYLESIYDTLETDSSKNEVASFLEVCNQANLVY